MSETYSVLPFTLWQLRERERRNPKLLQDFEEITIFVGYQAELNLNNDIVTSNHERNAIKVKKKTFPFDLPVR